MEEKEKKKRNWIAPAIGAVAGAVAGYCYYRFVGCATGACAITSSPVISALYGGIIGALIGSLFTGSASGGDGSSCSGGG